MTTVQIEIQLVAALVAVTCSLPGVFLILRRMAMMSDAISHAILLGIVLAFFVTRDISSPFLIIAAALTGLLTVSMVELLNRTGLVKEDAAIGLVFPLLFSLGVILISRFAGKVHLDTDAVLLGEIAFAPFNRLELFGYDLGPKALTVMAVILLVNLLFIISFYKELKLATFDAGLAAVLGFSPGIIHYGLMALVSVTAVGAFDAVGSILVVALMIGPPATAYLFCDRLSSMLTASALIGVVVAITGYWLAHFLDASISGCMATMAGIIFGLTFLFSPGRGLVAMSLRRVRQRLEFAQTMLVVHLYHHEGLPEEEKENSVEHLHEHLRWRRSFSERVVWFARERELVERQNGFIILTERGRAAAQKAITG